MDGNKKKKWKHLNYFLELLMQDFNNSGALDGLKKKKKKEE